MRLLERIVPSIAAADGAGVKLRRSLGKDPTSRLDPFLMLDAFSSENPDDYVAGFPPHPHRGFETVTYMLDSHLRHEDTRIGCDEEVRRLEGQQVRPPGRGHRSSHLVMIEEIAADPYNDRADLPALADSLQMEVDELFPVAETLQLLRFAEVEEGDITLTPAGARFADLDIDARKKLFGDHLLAYVPLAARIKAVLEERPSHTAPATRFREELEDYMSEDYAEKTLKSVITWGRFGEVFAYDEKTESLSLENPQ